MSRKKQNSEKFRNNPFQQVKGFSVCDKPQRSVAEVKQTAAPARDCGDDVDVDFAVLMEQIGVRQREDYRADKEPFDADDASDTGNDGDIADDDDAALFAAALGGLDKVFHDRAECGNDDDGVPVGGRRMRQLRKGKLRPQASIDLHGCYRDEAREKVRHFLRNRHAEGLHTLLIVTGRGKSSPGGQAVLRDDIEQYLATSARAWVAEWGRAPRQYGGDGALVVFLRRRK